MASPAHGHELLLGARWNCLTSLHAGDGQWIAELELPTIADGDWPTGFVHPALLDVAIGAAIGAAGGRGCVPISYRGVEVLCWPLPSRLTSHIVGGLFEDGHCSFAVTLADSDGRVVLRMNEYQLRRVGSEAAGPAQSVRTAGRSATLRSGFEPDQVLDLFDQALALDGEINVFACRSNLSRLIEENAGQISASQRAGAELDQVARVLKVMREVLGASQMGPDDDFFALGGDSIIALDVISRLNQAQSSGTNLAPNDLYQHSTPRGLATLVTNQGVPAAAAEIMLCRLRVPVPEAELQIAAEAVMAAMPQLPLGQSFAVIDKLPANIPDGLSNSASVRKSGAEANIGGRRPFRPAR